MRAEPQDGGAGRAGAPEEGRDGTVVPTAHTTAKPLGPSTKLKQLSFLQALPSESRRHLWALAETSY